MTQRGDSDRKHAAWLRECARRADGLAAEYRASADRIEARAAELEAAAPTGGMARLQSHELLPPRSAS